MRNASNSLHIYFSPIHSFIPMESTLRVSISLHAAHFEVGQKGKRLWLGGVGWGGWCVQGLEVEGDTVALAQLKSIAEEWKTTGRVGKTAQTQFGTFHIFALVLFWLPIFRRRGEPIIFIPTWHFLAAARRSTSRWLLACFGRGFSKGIPAAFERKNRLSGKLL